MWVTGQQAGQAPMEGLLKALLRSPLDQTIQLHNAAKITLGWESCQSDVFCQQRGVSNIYLSTQGPKVDLWHWWTPPLNTPWMGEVEGREEAEAARRHVFFSSFLFPGTTKPNCSPQLHSIQVKASVTYPQICLAVVPALKGSRKSEGKEWWGERKKWVENE